jgi:Xaa-Pro aminopeptidase
MVRFLNRTDALKHKAFEVKDFDGFLVTNEVNLLYFTGCPGLASLLIPKTGRGTIYVYNVNYEQAKAVTKGFNIEMLERGQNLMVTVAKQVKAGKIGKLAFDTLSFEGYRELAKGLRGNARLKGGGTLVSELRAVKDEKELRLVRKAADLANAGMKVAYEVTKPGLKEYEVAAEIEYAMRKRGSWGSAFETIVASGARSAFPHGGGGTELGGGCTDREIQRGDLVVVDMGTLYEHYRSDITRTLVAGKPSGKHMKLYETVRASHDRAFQAIRSGARAKDVDSAARKVITDAGYGEYFVHGLGHGVGLEVHEAPTLSSLSKDKLVPGNVVTDEPGIYLVGFGGVRIEDTVLVQKGKAEYLTSGLYGLEADS